ncbi:MAG: ribonuclease H family protein [Planctomycetota bacterium]|jgi:hypothetical protein
MALLVGIDEAGYGPLLGPLVVSCAAFELPESLLRENLWDILHKGVSQQKKGLQGRLLIADSKKAYNRKSGPIHLRRTVMSALGALAGNNSRPVTNAADFAGLLCPESVERLKDYPWYQSLESEPLGHDASDIQIASGVFQRTMAENGISLRYLQSRCLDVGFYNSRVETVKNKSRVLFTELCTLILNLLSHHTDGHPLQIVVDRQGGRINYQPELLRMFHGFELSVIRQDENMSSYELTNSSKSMRIHFCMKADVKYLPVSLASMASKYLREVLMEALNRHFCEMCPELKPTAGYWQDGQRFVKDLQTHLPDYSYDARQLIRIS